MKILGGEENSIKQRIRRIIAATILLFVLICLLISISIQQVFLSQAREYTLLTARKLENQLDFVYDKMDTFSMSIVSNIATMNLMSKPFSEKTKFVKEVEEMFVYYKILDPSILDISLVNEEVHYSTVYTPQKLDEMRLGEEDALFQWIGVERSDLMAGPAKKESMLVYARKIIEDGEDVGTVLISFDSAYFQMEQEEERDYCYMLVQEDGPLFAFGGGQERTEEIWKIWKDKEGGTEDGGRYIRGSHYYIRSVYSEEMGCYQLSALDVRQTGRNMQTIELLIWGCVLLLVFFFLFVFGVVDKCLVRPLNEFYECIRQIRTRKQRNMEGELYLGGCSEITEIGKEFTGMLADIDSLNRKIFETATDLYEMKVQKQEAELSWLRSQIDPHFLYNTLEVFRKKALERNAPEMAQMAVDMGNIFRYSIKGEALVPLRDEISMIKAYVRIQKTRFDGKIEVFYFLPNDTLDVPVMKMLLQPVVENAVFHGLEPKDGSGEKNIGCYGEGYRCLFSLTEGGPVLLTYDGKEYITRTPRVTYWRATTDNDRGRGDLYRCCPWLAATLCQRYTGEYRVDKLEDSVRLTFIWEVPGEKSWGHEISWQVFGDGSIVTRVSYPGVEGLEDMPAFGMEFKFRKKLNRFRYYGLGPEENYCDRRAGTKLSVFESTPQENLSAYLVPQECGNRTEVRWLELFSDTERDGIRFQAENGSFETSVLPYSAFELENALHMEELSDSSYTWVRILERQEGVGGDDSWGAPVHEAFRLPAKERRNLTFRITKPHL